jgi:transaldolase / glucose-6-phosphate isomerase
MNALLELINYGQSYWLDNLTRKMIKSGELKKRVAKEGLRGNTSNPAIFNKAISSGNDYDQQIKKLVGEKKTIGEIYDALTVKDVQDACDILKPVYDESNGLDGYISLEVSPYLAHDSGGTMNDARRLYKAVNRPNCFIKIPGTKEGVPAIEQMLYEGININVTLLFSIAGYEAVANAYVNALERRMAEGKPVNNVASVASFFLSRIDILTDQLLGHLIIPEKNTGNDPRPEHLLGKAAIASAKLAYQSFKRIFSGDKWQKLAEKGASVQRPLWASTSTKDPLYNDIKYVGPLIGKDTVNTMPEVTIAAFADHGKIEADAVEKDIDEAEKVFGDLKKIGIDIDFITDQLVNEGIQKFIDPFDNLMVTLSKKRKEILGNQTGFQKITYGKSESQVKEALKSLDEKQFTRRLFAKDPYLWKSDDKAVKAIRNRLGWININDFIEKASEIENFAKEIKQDKFKFVVLLGMGGSSLCPEVARETFGSKAGFPQLIMLDNTDPAAVKDVETKVNGNKTLFIVASKSGTTTETLSFYNYFYEVIKNQGSNHPGDHFAAITDEGTPLQEEAKNKNFRKVFTNPEDYGGRYSALSYFGLVPMALIGIDIKKILDNARQIEISSGAFIPSNVNPSINLGTFLGINQKQGRDKVTFILSESLSAFGYWVEQLIAESTGKEGTGLLPVEGESAGKPEVYNNDRVFVYLYTSEDDDEKNDKKLKALEKAGHPAVRIELQNKLALGAEFFRWELATATAGRIINVNPFDEPNVAESKKNSKDLLIEWKEKGSFGEGKPLLQDSEISVYCNEAAAWMFEGERKSIKAFLNKFVKLANSPDYLAMLAYFIQTPDREKILQSIRTRLRDRLKVATTLGYGPRYMHSTGQLHKGGPNAGVMILFTYDAQEDIAIPGSDYGFATLQRAQALGDFRSLNDKNRRVIRIHLGKNVEQSLKKLESSLKSE